MGQLLLLAAAMFVSMTIEFMPGGLLPGIAAGLGVGVPIAGQLVSVFAVTVVVSAAPLAAATRRAPRKPILLVAFSVIVVAGALCAVAPSFGLLAAARVLAGLGHALFWSVAGAYAAYLVPASVIGRATAVTASGGAVAGIVGGPIGNALGQIFGWRWAFVAMAGVGVVVLVLLVVCLPGVGVPAVRPGEASPARAARVPGRVLMLCGVLLVLVLAQSSFSTYIVPWLEGVVGLASTAVPLYLLATGIAAAVGVAVAGAMADRRPRATLLVAMGAIAAGLGLLPVVAGSPGLVVLAGAVVSASFGGVPPMLQAQLMRWSPEGARSMAVALQTTAINIGIGGGAAVGGVLVTVAPLGILPWFAGALTLLVLAGVAAGPARHG